MLVAIKRECDKKTLPKIDDYIRAQNKEIKYVCFEDMDISKEETGILGSPTYVYKAFRPQINKETKEIKENYSKAISDIIGGIV